MPSCNTQCIMFPTPWDILNDWYIWFRVQSNLFSFQLSRFFSLVGVSISQPNSSTSPLAQSQMEFFFYWFALNPLLNSVFVPFHSLKMDEAFTCGRKLFVLYLHWKKYSELNFTQTMYIALFHSFQKVTGWKI